MTPADYNFTIWKGSGVSERFEVFNADDTPMDLTGWQIISQIYAGKSRDAGKIADFTVTIDTPASGVFYLGLPHETTRMITAKKGYYDILFASPAGFRAYYCAGVISFKEGLSEPI